MLSIFIGAQVMEEEQGANGATGITKTFRTTGKAMPIKITTKTRTPPFQQVTDFFDSPR